MQEKPITLVSGIPRSGTSMMMRMLEAGGILPLTDARREADIDNPNGYYELEAVKTTKDDASWLTDAPGRAVKLIYSLLTDLPTNQHTYNVIFMRRDLDEVLRSQRRMLDRHQQDVTVPDAKMKSLFERELQQFDKWISNQPAFRLLNLNYTQLIFDPLASAENVAEFLNESLDTQKMAAVIDRSLYRNRAA